MPAANTLGALFTDPDAPVQADAARQKNAPEKKKPRGRPFTKGADPRRAGLPWRAEGEPCPACERDGRNPTGLMHLKHTRDGSRDFMGCGNYPRCTHATGPTAPPVVHGTQPENTRNTTESRVRTPTPTPETTPVPLTVNGPAPTVRAEPTPKPAAQPAQGDLLAALGAFVQQNASGAVDEETVRRIVAAELEARPAGYRGVEVKVGSAPAVRIEGAAHAQLTTALQRVAAGLVNVLLVGPAGCGKTTLGRQLAKALGRDFATVSCGPGMPESALLGRRVPNLTTGEETYIPAPFVRLYEGGGVFLLDEIDNADASVLLVLNAALANGHLTLPDGREVSRSADFVLVASANTYGHGADRLYVGRTQLDAATLDRFTGATLTLDYDRALETALCPEKAVRDAVWAVRDKARALKLRRIVSTRAVLAVRSLHAGTQMPLPDAVAACCEGWTDDDRRACGVKARA